MTVLYPVRTAYPTIPAPKTDISYGGSKDVSWIHSQTRPSCTWVFHMIWQVGIWYQLSTRIGT